MMLASKLFLFLTTCARLGSSQAFASWRIDGGTQLFHQNASTGDLMYTIQTEDDSGSGTFTHWANVPLEVPARMGTRLAAASYTGGDGDIYGVLYYLARAGNIQDVDLHCTLPAGTCIVEGSSEISSAGVDNATSLAASNHKRKDEYRLFYHDSRGKVRQIRYNDSLEDAGIPTGYREALVFNDSSAYPTSLTKLHGAANLTLYALDTQGNIQEAALIDSNDNFKQLPKILTTHLHAWDPSNITLSASFDSNTSPSISHLFYIGTDRSLHHLTSTGSSQTYRIAPRQKEDIWPLADDCNAAFTTVSSGDGSETRLFWISNGALVTTTLNNGTWSKAQAIFDSLTSYEPASTHFIDGAANLGIFSSSGSRIGVGVGVSVGLALLVTIVMISCLYYRKRRSLILAQQKRESEWSAPVLPAYSVRRESGVLGNGRGKRMMAERSKDEKKLIRKEVKKMEKMQVQFEVGRKAKKEASMGTPIPEIRIQRDGETWV